MFATCVTHYVTCMWRVCDIYVPYTKGGDIYVERLRGVVKYQFQLSSSFVSTLQLIFGLVGLKGLKIWANILPWEFEYLHDGLLQHASEDLFGMQDEICDSCNIYIYSGKGSQWGCEWGIWGAEAIPREFLKFSLLSELDDSRILQCLMFLNEAATYRSGLHQLATLLLHSVFFFLTQLQQEL